MIYRIDFDKVALKTIAKYKKSNPQRFKKLKKLLDDISEHPRTGIGHPEPLIGGNNITYSFCVVMLGLTNVNVNNYSV